MQKTFLEIWIVFLVGRVKLFNFKLFKQFSHKLLGLDHEFQVFILTFGLQCKFFAVGDAVSDLKEFLSDFGDCKGLAFLDFSE